MKKILSIIALSIAFIGGANAVVVQKIYLKNGSVLSGYIQKQDGKGNLTFHSDNAEICIKSKDATISNERNYNIKDLNDAWVKWAEKNEEFEGVGDNRTIFLADVATKTKHVSKVKILERGTIVKYLEMTPNVYNIAWKDVNYIKGEKRSKTALSGINRKYQLKSGMEFEGQYAEENDSTLSLYMNNGVRHSFKINDVIKYVFLPINPNQDIFAQSELLDVVKAKNGNEVRGIIIEQNYSSNKDSENYFLIQQESGAIQSIKVSEISETRKEENPKFDPKYDILLKSGEVVINRQEAKVLKVKEEKGELILDSLNNDIVIKKDANNNTLVTIEYRDDNGSNAEIYKLVKVRTKTVKKNTVYGFTFKDVVNSPYRPRSIETSVNHTTKVEYIVGGEGTFVLYDSKKQISYCFTIK